MINPVEALETASNALTKQGKIIVSIDEFYADDCVFIEPDGPRRSSRKDQRAHLQNFFGSLKSFDGAVFHGQAVGENMSMSEWTFNFTGGDGKPFVWNEVFARKWRGNKIILEKYYTA